MAAIEQVQLSKLIFTHSWEDPSIDESALRPAPGDTLFTITSGGCNTLGLLRFKPAAIYCVDINPAQTWLMELKKTAIASFSYDEFLQFMGLRDCPDRLRMYERLKGRLTPEAQHFWQGHGRIVREGIIMNGRYERFSKIAGRLIRLLQGGRKTRRLFEPMSLIIFILTTGRLRFPKVSMRGRAMH